MINPDGPAGACVRAAFEGVVFLHCTEIIIAEVVGVARREPVRTRFGITDDRVASLAEAIRGCAVMVERVPVVFEYDRDPDDAHYVNLAIATGSACVVTRDNDLLALGDDSTPQGRHFRARFSTIRFLTPPAFLQLLRPRAQ